MCFPVLFRVRDKACVAGWPVAASPAVVTFGADVCRCALMCVGVRRAAERAVFVPLPGGRRFVWEMVG